MVIIVTTKQSITRNSDVVSRHENHHAIYIAYIAPFPFDFKAESALFYPFRTYLLGENFLGLSI